MKIESLIPPSLELRTKFIPVSVSRYRSYYNIFGVVTPMAILLPENNEEQENLIAANPGQPRHGPRQFASAATAVS